MSAQLSSASVSRSNSGAASQLARDAAAAAATGSAARSATANGAASPGSGPASPAVGSPVAADQGGHSTGAACSFCVAASFNEVRSDQISRHCCMARVHRAWYHPLSACVQSRRRQRQSTPRGWRSSSVSSATVWCAQNCKSCELVFCSALAPPNKCAVHQDSISRASSPDIHCYACESHWHAHAV